MEKPLGTSAWSTLTKIFLKTGWKLFAVSPSSLSATEKLVFLEMLTEDVVSASASFYSSTELKFQPELTRLSDLR